MSCSFAAETSSGGGMAAALMLLLLLLLLLHTLTLNCTLRRFCQKLKTQQSDVKTSGSDETVKVETPTSEFRLCYPEGTDDTCAGREAARAS